MKTGHKDKIGFDKLLQENHDWPCKYSFKFIMPEPELKHFATLINDRMPYETPVTVNLSQKGKYASICFELECKSPREVLSLYHKVSDVNGLVSL